MEKFGKLMPHNFEAYTKVKEQFKVSDRACVVHATGTGKSYIIAATAEDYDRVLILAPNNYVLSELDKTVGAHCKLMTYKSLTLVEDMEDMKGFDLIVLDEFHRTGAKVWGASVKELLQVNPGVKVLGTTATEIRTSGRNMADEMFDGNVVSRLTLPMAWSQRILRVPTYVTGLYTFDEIDRELRTKITGSTKSEEEKRVSLAELDSIRLDWVNSYGTDTIIKKYINPDSRRIIVFCDKIKYISEVKNSVKSWLLGAGLKIHKIYSVNSKNYNSKEDMRDFEREDGFSGVKVMFAVNMLNEGIHTKDIDAVIMLRPTRSKIVYFQQMGRCMAADSTKSPVIFDLVDNLDNTDQIVAMQKELNRLEDERLVKVRTGNGYTDRVSFDIIDYMVETRELVERLNSKYSFRSFDENLEELKEFCEEYNRLPWHKYSKIESRLSGFIRYHREHPQIISILEKYRKARFKSYEENLEDLRKFIETYDKLPTKEDSRLRNFIEQYRNKSEVAEIVEQNIRYNKAFSRNLADLEKFVKEFKRRPKSNSKNKLELHLGKFISKHRSDPRVISITMAFGRSRISTAFNKNLEDLRKFVKKYNKLPSRSDCEMGGGRLESFCQKHKSHPEVSEIIEKYRRWKKSGPQS